MSGKRRPPGGERTGVGGLWHGFVRRMWEHFTIKKAWARSVLVDVKKRRARRDRRRHETPYKEELELVRHNSDLRFEGSLSVVPTTPGGQMIGKAFWKNSDKTTDSAFGQVFKSGNATTRWKQRTKAVSRNAQRTLCVTVRIS